MPKWQVPHGGRGVDIKEAPIAEGPVLGGGHAGQGSRNALLMRHHICISLQPVHTLQQLCLLQRKAWSVTSAWSVAVSSPSLVGAIHRPTLKDIGTSS